MAFLTGPILVEFDVPGVAVAQPRHDFRCVKSKKRRGFIAIPFLPRPAAGGDHPVVAYKERVRHHAQIAMNRRSIREPVTLPLLVEMVFLLPRLQEDRRAGPERFPAVKGGRTPDLDNLQKSTLDALKGLLFVDDKQICQIHGVKLFKHRDEEPCTKIVFREYGVRDLTPDLLDPDNLE